MDPELEAYQQEQQDDFDYDGFILRRADPDDCDQIINLVEIGKDDVYNRVYSYPRILKLIESAFLAITVLDREGNVVAFAAFEDFPQGMRGMQDDKHYNYWENWFKQAYQIDEFSAMNTLWLSYFIAGGSISYKQQKHGFKKILQTVYTSLSDIIGILFLARGDADDDDINYCFDPLSVYFEEVECKDQKVLQNVRGIAPSSRVFFSSRVLMLPFIEVRKAKQEDHDDLADIFNNQSETVTEAYGEYFLAELIAAQSNDNKALVAQVKDKAVGLMGLTNEVDTSLLHQCFELDQFDNLLKPDYMDAIRKRREYLIWEAQVEAEKKRIEFLKQMKQETMNCHAISQRITLQEYLVEGSEEILKEIDEWMADDEKIKTLNKQQVDAMIDTWLANFKILQPSQFFKDHPTNDSELVCSIQTEKEFLMSTLEYFGLPKDYMNGAGHFPNWGKEKKDDKAAQARKRAAAKNQKKGKANDRVAKLKKARGMETKNEDDIKPTHFDISVFLKSFKRFIACNGELRSQARKLLLKDINRTMSVFLDDYKEQSFKKCVDVYELASLLVAEGYEMDPILVENLGAMLMCFGEIEHEQQYGQRIPPETEDEKRARIVAELKAKEKEEARKEAEANGQEFDENEIKVPVIEPRMPILMLLHLISITDMKFCAQKMFEFDKTLAGMGIQTYDIKEEQSFMAMLTKKYKKKFYDEEEVHKMADEPSKVYSDNSEIQNIVEKLDNLTAIPEAPDSLKNAFAITLFCMEAAFDSRSTDFLKYAFDEYPDRDYLIVTQPHTVVESQLLSKFTHPGKRTKNTFQHVLYIMHRDSLMDQDMYVQRVVSEDLEEASELCASLDEHKKMYDVLYDCAVNPSSTNYGFVAKIAGQIIGVFCISKDVNLEYYISHFHVQDQILIAEQDRKSHTRLLHSCINPIFEKSTRFMLKELLRLTQKTCLYFEVNTETIIPTIFHELVHIRSRRFPHFLDRKWDHERFVSEDVKKQQDDFIKNKVDGARRDPLDETEAPFALCFTTRRMLSEPKIVKNARIVVVGASDTSISFIEALLSISYLQFSSIVLVAPGGLPHNHFIEKKENLKAYSTSYTREELKKLMLESRIRVINARMVDIDRSDKNIVLHDETVIPYDTLILGMGIQDKTLNSLDYASRGIATPGVLKRADQILSIDDPHLYQHLRVGGTLVNILTDKKRVKNCVIYGRTLHTYCCIQGLIQRGVKPEQIILANPEPQCHVEESYDEPDIMAKDMPFIYPDAFDDEAIEGKVQKILENMGVRIIKNTKLIEIIEDGDEGLEAVLFKRLDIPDEEEDEDEIEGIEEKSEGQGSNMGSGAAGTGEDGSQADEDGEQEADLIKQKKKRKKNELEIECRVLITAGHRDVDADVFSAIHNNGLVYNGRLIVDKSFQTTDPSIFAAGSLCEFSGRYQALSQGRPLRMDRYNGREMGSRLARSVFDIYDSQANPEGMEDELPSFYLPQGQGGVLPGDLIYYHIQTTNPLLLNPDVQEIKNRKSLTCDNLDPVTNKGHLIKFTFNSIGLIDSVTYMGTEEVVLQSLWSFVGLHENYLNSLTSRYEQGIIPNVVEFLSENWAIALYHEWFGDFCLRMRQSVQGMTDIQGILEKAFETTKNGEGISREQIEDFKKMVEPNTIRMIQDETLEFIKTNMNHLPMYYIPQKEFE